MYTFKNNFSVKQNFIDLTLACKSYDIMRGIIILNSLSIIIHLKMLEVLKWVLPEINFSWPW